MAMKRLATILFVLIAQQLSAQSVLRLQHLNVDDGLSQSSVYHIFQDAHGFMWFATGDGLDRYDGKEFVVYKSKFNDTLASQMKDRNINSRIFEDKYNRFWLATDAGISYMNSKNGKFGVVLDKSTAPFQSILITTDSNFLWSAIPQYGIYAVNLANFQSTAYPFTDPLQNQRSIVYPIYNGATVGNNIWITDRGGLMVFDKRTHTDTRVLVSDKISSVYLLHSGKLLLTATDGVFLFDTLTRKAEFIAAANEHGTPFLWKNMAEDQFTGTIYLGAMNSGTICRINLAAKNPEFINFQNYIVNSLCIDRSQNLWVGTEGNGIFKLDIKQPKFSCYKPDPSPDDDGSGLMVKSLYKDDSGKIWIGTYDNGLIVFDPIKRTSRNIAFPFSVEKKYISTILRDSANNLVITAGSNILWLDPVSGKIKEQLKLPLSLALSPEEPVIYSLIEWQKGHYLVATNLSLYTVMHEKGALTQTRPYIIYTDQYLSSHIYNVQQDKNGTVYVGKRNGYSRIQMCSDTSLRVLDEAFEHVGIRHFYKSETTPILWIASEKGLIAYNENSKQHRSFDESDGLNNSCVYAILAQNDTAFWISTNQGISYVKVHYGNGTDIKAQFINYTSKDGLQSNEFNTGAYCRGKDGSFIFGGIAGINWFDPYKIQINQNKAIPVISHIYVNDFLIARDSAAYVHTLVLPYDSSTISFSLSALEFTRPEQNLFKYKLEGLDKDWVIGPDKVRYPSLPPGTYYFLLKVSNNEGVWNETPLQMKIVILPPFYQTWWFRMLVIACSISLIFLSARLYVKQKIRSKTRELEKQQALYRERLRISKDVHDDLGSGLSKISLIAGMVQSRTHGDALLDNDIKQISNVSRELVDNMHDLIWVLNPENTTLEQLVSRLREYCADYLENMPIKVTLHFPDAVPTLRILSEGQRNIFLTTKEAINNCIKHAEASEISIVLTVNAGILKISVTDNGNGFDMAHLKGSGNGLRNMKQRIELIGGSFVITTLPGGTTITMSIPFENLSVEKNNT